MPSIDVKNECRWENQLQHSLGKWQRFALHSNDCCLVVTVHHHRRQCLLCCPHDHGHCESSPGSFDECRLSAGWPPTLRPSQPTWAVSLPINGCYHPHPPSPFVIIT